MVLTDADLDTTAEVAVMKGYVNSGQACYAVNRVLVPPTLAGGLLERMRARIADLRLGPMTTDRGLARHHMLLADARERGARVEGGEEIAPGQPAPALVPDAGPRDGARACAAAGLGRRPLAAGRGSSTPAD